MSVTAEYSTVSVVVPVFENPIGLSTTLDALVTSSTLAYATEIIVVDDGSSHQSAEEIERSCSRHGNVRLHRTANRGPAAARNAGASLDRGTHVTFLDVKTVDPIEKPPPVRR